MSSSWPQLDDLIRELGDVCALPDAEGEPALSAATMAVTKATTALAHAAQARGRSSQAALAKALQTVEEARSAVQQARNAITSAAARRGPRAGATASAARPGQTVDRQVDGSCPACGRAFVVRYRTVKAAPVVAFPVACPLAECDGVAAVEYPESAVDVSVEPVAS
jgi:hypothetical protein